MLAADGGDIVVAAITAVGIVMGAGIAAFATVSTARAQRSSSIVERVGDDDPRIELANERAKRLRAEAERDVWKEIALNDRPKGVDPPNPTMPD